MKGSRSALWLLTSTAVGIAMIGSGAWAQAPGAATVQAPNTASGAGAEAAASAQNASQGAAEGMLGEVVVTATRQANTVNRVPLSITAVTQRGLDQQGVKNVQDLSRTVPSLSFRRSGLDANPQIAIRGIVSNLGASTTGIYLDDVALQKRGINGAVTGNGTPIPALFDLERVEVLRGPQGTLFGSGSEGGTIRFIQPEPSLTRYSSYARAEVSNTEMGSLGYEGGAAIGGPIIADKLGFRVAAFGKHTAGVLDHVSIYDGHTIAEDTDYGNQGSVRVALAWKPTERLRITPSAYYSEDFIKNQSTWWYDVPRYTTQGGTFTNRVRVGEGAAAPNSTGYWMDFPNSTLPSYSFGPYNYFGPWKTPQALYFNQNCGACTDYTPFGPTTINIAGATVNGVTYPGRTITIPGQQPGPNAASIEDALSPRKSTLFIPSVTLDYDFGWFDAKSITGLTVDETEVSVGGGLGIPNAIFPNSTSSATTVGGQFINAGGANIAGGTVGTPIFPVGAEPLPAAGTGGAFIVLPGQPYRLSILGTTNKRTQFSQEFRFSSKNEPGQRLTWVGGGYYSFARQTLVLDESTNFDSLSYFYRGIENAFIQNGWMVAPDGRPSPVGFTCDPTPTGARPNATYNCVQTEPSVSLRGESYAHTERFVREWEVAAFGEANFMVTSKLKATAGVRISRLSNAYTQRQWGSTNGSPLPPQFIPTPPSATDLDGNPYPTGTQNYQNTTTGVQKATPINPKFGLSYQADPTTLVYATAAKGFRAGGVNVPASPSNCGPDLAALGLTTTPGSYEPDSVWSYEGGAKVRILGAQVNASLFYIDWKEPQLTIRLGCQSAYITNAGKAVSKGGDIQVVKRFGGLTLAGSVAYTDAEYTQTVSTPGTAGRTIITVLEGDPLPISRWQMAFSAQYDWKMLDKYNAYARMDYQYSSPFINVTPWQTTFDPITYKTPVSNFVTARAGVGFGSWDVNVFVNNLTNAETILGRTHGTGAANVTATSVRPREIGLQLTYRR